MVVKRKLGREGKDIWKGFEPNILGERGGGDRGMKNFDTILKG